MPWATPSRTPSTCSTASPTQASLNAIRGADGVPAAPPSIEPPPTSASPASSTTGRPATGLSARPGPGGATNWPGGDSPATPNAAPAPPHPATSCSSCARSPPSPPAGAAAPTPPGPAAAPTSPPPWTSSAVRPTPPSEPPSEPPHNRAAVCCCRAGWRGRIRWTPAVRIHRTACGRQFSLEGPGLCAAAPPPTRPPQHPSHPLRCAPREASWASQPCPRSLRGRSGRPCGGGVKPAARSGRGPPPLPAKDQKKEPTVDTTRLIITLHVVADVDLEKVAARDGLDPAKDKRLSRVDSKIGEGR